MTESSYPIPKIIQRTVNQSAYDAALTEGYSEILAKIIAARALDPLATSINQALKPKLRDILSPNSLKDIDKAVARLIKAKTDRELISLAVDFDADGQTSLSVLYRGLVLLGFQSSRLMIHCSHRLKEGYGLNDKSVDRILVGKRPTLIVTADNGSSNTPQIDRLANEGIDVIVTDHHALLDGPPSRALAVINPIREDCDFPDKSIAGCSVAFFLLVALRQKLIDMGQLESSVSIASLLTFAGVGIQADCVHLGNSMSNRAMVRFALASINRGSQFVCWDALKQLGRPDHVIDSEFLSFTIAPAINAAGRLAEAKHAGELFLTEDIDKANTYVSYLKTLNDERKKIERKMAEKAKRVALDKHSEGAAGLCVYLPDGNPGVIGIVASRVTQTFGKPSCILAPMVDTSHLLTGSIRAVDGYSVIEGIEYINREFPLLIERGGGHHKAGGVTLNSKNLAEFEKAFDLSVRQQVGRSEQVPVLQTDGVIAAQNITLELVRSISDLQPFGQGFPKPVFEITGTLTTIRMVGDPKIHAQLTIEVGRQKFKGIWFFSLEHEDNKLPVIIGNTYRFIFSLGENKYKQNTYLQLIISGVVDL